MQFKNIIINLAKLAGIILIVMAAYRFLGFLGIWLFVMITFGFAGFILWKRWDLYKTLCLYGAKQLDKTVSGGEVFGRRKKTARSRTEGTGPVPTTGRSTSDSSAGGSAEGAEGNRGKHGEH